LIGAAPSHRSDAPVRSADGYFHPSTEEELVALVRLARHEGVSLRVRGSGHSIPAAIDSDGRAAAAGPARRGVAAPSSRDIDVRLDRYTRVDIDVATGRATVQAGCRLGEDPRDRTGLSTFDASLVAQLDRRGLALPDLGGVTHQTVAGFLMTGSCGGTVRYSNEDAIVAFRFIDGEGRVHEVDRDQGDLFDAFGCSMGLLGVLSTVTFAAVPRYDILGREDISPVGDAPLDLCGAGAGGLGAFLRETEYARLMWWPQAGVDRLVTWQARRMRAEDYRGDRGTPGGLRPRPYDALRTGLTSPVLSRGVSLASQWAGGKILDAIAGTSALGRVLAGRGPALAAASGRAAALAQARILPTVLDPFVPLDRSGAHHFWDSWWRGLPMDNQMSERSLPTTFTEIWVPLDDAAAVMTRLRDHFREHGHAGTGAYIFEVYAARASRFWMHAGHGRDSLRFDVFWFERNPGDPTTTFFVQFWRLLQPFGYRLHWGKHLPKDDSLGADYLRRQFPRWDDFLALRESLDPHGIFLNRHFRKALGVRS
jgi:D-arabinono-1,4-lactone oxidase